MAQTLAELVAEAEAQVPTITPEEATGLDNVVFVDVREPAEVEESGKIAGALNVPRGVLEFRTDPSRPDYIPELDRNKTVVTYCRVGGRAALAAATLKNLGFTDVRHMGAFKDWAEKGLPVEK